MSYPAMDLTVFPASCCALGYLVDCKDSEWGNFDLILVMYGKLEFSFSKSLDHLFLENLIRWGDFFYVHCRSYHHSLNVYDDVYLHLESIVVSQRR